MLLTSDLGGRASFAGRDHNQQFHNGIIDLGTAGLHNEDILLSDTIEHLDARLALQRRGIVSLTLPQDVAATRSWVNSHEGKAQRRKVPTLEN